MSVSPRSGVPGSTVTVSVAQFHADLPVEIRWQGSGGQLMGSATPGLDGTAQVSATIPAGAVAGTAAQVIVAVQYKDGVRFGNVGTLVVSTPQAEATPERDAGNRSPESRDPLETSAEVRPVPEPRTTPVPESAITPVRAEPEVAPALPSASPAFQDVARATPAAVDAGPRLSAPEVVPADEPTATSPVVAVEGTTPEPSAVTSPVDPSRAKDAPSPAADAGSATASFGSPSAADGVSPVAVGIGLLSLGLVALFAGFTVAEARRRRVTAAVPAQR